MGGCAAVSCTNHSRKGYRMFRFPTDKERRKKWIINCRRHNWEPGPGAQLCIMHFDEDQWEKRRADGVKKLKRNAVPTIFSHVPVQVKRKLQKELAALREAGLLNDVTQEVPRDVQNNNSVQQTSNALNYPMHRVSQDTNILNVVSSVLLDINSSDVTSNVSQVNNFSQVAPTTVVKDISTFPIADNAVQNYFSSQALSSNQPCTSSSVDGASTSTLPVVSTSQGSNEMCVISNNDSSTLSSDSTAFRTTERVSKFIAEQKIYDLSQKVILKPLKKKKKPKPVVIYGRRIIDFEFFFNSLKCINNHSDRGCNLNDMIVTGEVKSALYRAFKLNCTVCDFEETIHSESQCEEKNLNADFVAGMLSISCHYKSAKKLLKKLNLPLLDQAYFTKECEKKLLSKRKNKGTAKILKKRSQATVEEDYNFPITHKTSKKLKKNLTCQKTKKNILEKESLLENVDLSELLVEDQIEIKEERNDNVHENDSEAISGETIMKAREDKLVKTKEQESLNMTMIKQEINSDVDDEDLTGSKTSEMETVNKVSTIECDDLSVQQKQVRTCEEKMAVDQEQVECHKTPVIQNTQDGNKLVELVFNGTETNKTLSFTSKLNQTCFEFDNQPEVELPLKKCRTVTHENRVVINQKDIKLDDEKAKQNLYSVEDSKTLTKPKKTIMHKKGVVSCHKTKSGTKTADQQIRSETNGLGVATSSTLNKKNVSFISVQYIPKEKSDVMSPQMPCNLTNRTYDGVNQPAFIPVTSSVIQQQTGESNNPLLPLVTPVTQHSPSVSIYNSSNQNRITILPGINQTAFVPVTSTVIQQQTGGSNSVLLPLFTQHSPSVNNYSIPSQNPLIIFPGVNRTAYMPSPPTIIPQLTNLSNNVSLHSASDDSRCIRQQNIISNNPSFSLSNEIPREVSNSIPLEPNGGHSSHKSH